MLLQFGALLTDDASSVNYKHNMFIIQATGECFGYLKLVFESAKVEDNVIEYQIEKQAKYIIIQIQIFILLEFGICDLIRE